MNFRFFRFFKKIFFQQIFDFSKNRIGGQKTLKKLKIFVKKSNFSVEKFGKCELCQNRFFQNVPSRGGVVDDYRIEKRSSPLDSAQNFTSIYLVEIFKTGLKILLPGYLNRSFKKIRNVLLGNESR